MRSLFYNASTCHNIPRGVFGSGGVVKEMLLCLHRGEGQEQRQEPVASGINGSGENAAPENPISTGNSRVVQKEGKHKPGIVNAPLLSVH